MTTHHNFKTMWNFRSFTLNPSLTQNGIRKYCSIQKLLNDLEAWATLGNCCLVPLLGYGDLSKFSIRFQVLTVEWVRHDKFFFQIWEGVSEIEILLYYLIFEEKFGSGGFGLGCMESYWKTMGAAEVRILIPKNVCNGEMHGPVMVPHEHESCLDQLISGEDQHFSSCIHFS